MEIKLATEMKSPSEIQDLWKAFRKETIRLLKSVPAEKFTERQEGRWSIAELAEHLYLSQWTIVRPTPMVLGGKIGESVGPQPDLDYIKIRNGFMKTVGVKNPESVQPLNNYSLEEVLTLLEKSEKKMDEVLAGKTKSELETRGFKHPILGLLNLFNFLWVMALHEHSHMVTLKDRVAKL